MATPKKNATNITAETCVAENDAATISVPVNDARPCLPVSRQAEEQLREKRLECEMKNLEAEEKRHEIEMKRMEAMEAALEKEHKLRLKTLDTIDEMLTNNRTPSNEIQIKILETAIAMYNALGRPLY